MLCTDVTYITNSQKHNLGPKWIDSCYQKEKFNFEHARTSAEIKTKESFYSNNNNDIITVILYTFCFEIWSHSVAQIGLNLESSCPSLLPARITGVCPHASCSTWLLCSCDETLTQETREGRKVTVPHPGGEPGQRLEVGTWRNTACISVDSRPSQDDNQDQPPHLAIIVIIINPCFLLYFILVRRTKSNQNSETCHA